MDPCLLVCTQYGFITIQLSMSMNVNSSSGMHNTELDGCIVLNEYNTVFPRSG